MIASRGIGASLDDIAIKSFRKDLMNMIDDNELEILHEAVIVKLRKV